MKHNFRILSAIILSCVLLILSVGCKDNSTKKPIKKSTANSTDTTQQDNNESILTQQDDNESIPESSDDQSFYIDSDNDYRLGTGSLNGTITNKYQRDDIDVKNVKFVRNEPMAGKGGAEKEADALRKKILSAPDNLKITGTKYYFSPGGDNDNNGTSPNTPFRTLDMLDRITLQSGDGVLLERGSVFRISATIYPVDGVSYGAYGKGKKPEIWGSEQNYAGQGLWSPHNIKNIWALHYVSNDVGIVLFNYGEAYAHKRFSIRNLNKDLDFYYDTNGFLYLYSTTDPNTRFKSIEIGAKRSLFGVPAGAKDITVDNLCFKFTSGHALNTAGNTKNITITNCEFGWIGGAIMVNDGNARERYGNAIEFWNSAENSLVQNCWIYNVFDAGITIQGYGYFKNTTFNENLIEYTAFSIEWWHGNVGQQSPENTGIENFKITNNIIRFPGYGFESAYRIDSGRDAAIVAGSLIGQKDIPIFKKYVVTGNIFDGAYTSMIVDMWAPDAWKRVKSEYKFIGNSYYIGDRTGKNWLYGNKGNQVLAFGSNDGIAEFIKANNQKEFKSAIAVIDKQPKKVKWLNY